VGNAIILAFSAHLRRLREEKKMSQEDLAFESDLSRHTILRIEKGVHNPSLVALVALSRGLQISLLELLNFPVPE